MQEKICTKCGERKPLDEFYFECPSGKGKKPHFRPQCKECEKTRVKKWHKKNHAWIEAQRERLRFSNALKNSSRAAAEHGYRPCNATEDEIRETFTGFCHNPGCRVPESECNSRLCLDHNHETGAHRGWLCDNCNRSAGLLRESSDIILGLAEYVEADGKLSATGYLKGKPTAGEAN